MAVTRRWRLVNEIHQRNCCCCWFTWDWRRRRRWRQLI